MMKTLLFLCTFLLAACASIHSPMIWKIERDGQRSMFIKRHKIWVPLIERYHSVHPPAFIAVGLAHMLVEKDSLLDMLKARGFTVEPIDRVP